ncbi:MAG: hypothetical protein GF329_18870 [Candidatus Lokiarchaeota archaeon]|nr:hypothetical protein [Candidatus Lokiarchaeota archaeon]
MKLFSGESQENFESLIDLFTLLSFSLILVAVYWGIMSLAQFNGSTFKFSEMEPTSAKPVVQIPETLIVLFLTQFENSDVLYLINSKAGTEIIYNSSFNQPIDPILEQNSETIMESERIQFIVDTTVKLNPFLLVKIQKWFAKYNLEVDLNFYDRN